MTRSVAETNVTLAATVSPSRSETHWSSLRLTERLRSLGVLFLLSLILPFTLLVVLAAWVLSTPMRVLQSRRKASGGRKTILLSGGKMTKSLQLARAFHAAGHRVLLCETEKYACSGSRFSNAVDGFFTTPRPDESDYADKLKQIVVENDVDVYVPVCSPVASRYDAEAGEILADHCEVIHATSEAVSLLDDKYRFATKAHELGLGAPKSHLITTADQVVASGIESENRRYILKSIAYDPVRRLDLTKLPLASREATLKYVRQLPISVSNPWILQEFIPGEEFCTHSTVRGGEVTAHCCCRS
ncbi:MAG: ATP-grasp enzyme, partial [Planctomycetota bacterium]